MTTLLDFGAPSRPITSEPHHGLIVPDDPPALAARYLAERLACANQAGMPPTSAYRLGLPDGPLAIRTLRSAWDLWVTAPLKDWSLADTRLRVLDELHESVSRALAAGELAAPTAARAHESTSQDAVFRLWRAHAEAAYESQPVEADQLLLAYASRVQSGGSTKLAGPYGCLARSFPHIARDGGHLLLLLLPSPVAQLAAERSIAEAPAHWIGARTHEDTPTVLRTALGLWEPDGDHPATYRCGLEALEAARAIARQRHGAASAH